MDLLSNQEALIMEAVISGASFFRLQVGAYDTSAGADALCAKLKQQGVECLVVGP
jgi:cell division protein FtsN